jgi:hypothetical protein
LAAKGKKRQHEIAGRLLLLRERLYDNASEMARSVKLTPQRWYNYETGRRALDADTAAIVVEEHGVDYNWLFGGRLDTLKKEVRILLLGDPKRQKYSMPLLEDRRPRKAKAKRKTKRKSKTTKRGDDNNNGPDPQG